MIDQLQRDAMLRRGSPPDDLMAFVQSEIGRSADERLEGTKSLILYFRDDQERDGFIADVRAAKPGMMTKKLP